MEYIYGERTNEQALSMLLRQRADANQLREKLDDGLRKLRANGGLSAILKSYDLKDWATK